MNKTLLLLSLEVSKHLRCRLFLLTLLLCGFMPTMAETWTDGNGITWSFTVNGTEATDIRFHGGPDIKKVYLYGDVENYPDQVPFVPAAWNAADMRFSSAEGTHLPTIPDDVYFSLKTLVFDVSDVTDNFDLRVMNGWWSNTYYDHVKWENGLNELQITDVMARECAKGGEGRDLDLMLYSGSMTLNAVYYESSEVSGDLEIPSKVYVGSTELTVTSVGDRALSGNAGLTSVTIPEGVTSIGNYAFYDCSGLTSITIPEGVAGIGNYAFAGCNNLTSVTIPSGVTSIGDGTFRNCNNLTSVTIPSSVTSIGNDTFAGCYGLTSVTIPEGVTTIGEWAFSYCYALPSVTIPSNVTSIGNYAFYACSGLTSVSIPSSVTSIGNNAFSNCSLTSVTIPSNVTSIGFSPFGCPGLTSISVESGNSVYDSRNNCNAIIETATNTLIQGCKNTIFPEGVTSIGNGAFSGCSSLTSVTIPTSVTSIGSSAFNSCTSLTSVTIPEGVTSIGNAAFDYCISLTSVTIPSSVTSIDNYAFFDCTGLTTVTSLIKEPFTIEENVFTYYDIDVSWNPIFTSSTLYVPVGTKSLYEATPAWNQFQDIVEMQYIDPIDGETTVNTEGLGGQDLTDNVVDGVYYNLNGGNSGYDSTDGSIVIGETTNMGQITNPIPGTSDVANNFTGLILSVAAGKGTIIVNIKTVGNAQLVVQVGNGTPMIATKTEQGNVVVNYDVAEDTYIYIYAIIGSSSAPSLRAASDNVVKIYGITVTPESTGIHSIDNGQLTIGNYYTLDGRKLDGVPAKKGLYIVNGRKVVMK